jgi:hypothetical protein
MAVPFSFRAASDTVRPDRKLVWCVGSTLTSSAISGFLVCIMAMPVLGERHLALAEHVPHEAPGRYACLAPYEPLSLLVGLPLQHLQLQRSRLQQPEQRPCQWACQRRRRRSRRLCPRRRRRVRSGAGGYSAAGVGIGVPEVWCGIETLRWGLSALSGESGGNSCCQCAHQAAHVMCDRVR